MTRQKEKDLIEGVVNAVRSPLNIDLDVVSRNMIPPGGRMVLLCFGHSKESIAMKAPFTIFTEWGSFHIPDEAFDGFLDALREDIERHAKGQQDS